MELTRITRVSAQEYWQSSRGEGQANRPIRSFSRNADAAVNQKFFKL